MELLISASLLSPIYTAFGWLLQQLYLLLNNYGVAIIFYTLIVRLLFIPFNVKQHKSSLQQQALQPQLDELQRIYKNDKEKFSMAQMELYKENGVSMLGGCLPLLLSMVIMWPVYRVVSGPLHYMMGLPAENLQALGELLVDKGILASGSLRQVDNFNIVINEALRANPQVYLDAVREGLIRASDLINMEFLGINLGLTPTFNLGLLMGPERATYLPLLIFPLLTALTSFLPTMVAEKLNPLMQERKKQQERAKVNPAQQNPNDMSQMTGCMKWSMPLMMVFFSFSMPAAMGLYWIIGNLMAVVQSLILYRLYTEPFYRAVEAQRSQKVMTREEAAESLALEQQNSGKAQSKAQANGKSGTKADNSAKNSKNARGPQKKSQKRK